MKLLKPAPKTENTKSNRTRKNIIFKGLPEYFKQGDLINYLERCVRIQVRSLLFSSTPGTVMAEFDHNPGTYK